MTIKNLWGEIKDLPKIKSPVAVLNEQAQLLEHFTNGLLTGRTVRINVGDNNHFRFEFSINAPSLNNYSYIILQINHDIGLYPLSLSSLNGNQSTNCQDINEFELELEKIFSSPEIQRVISGLLAQIQST